MASKYKALLLLTAAYSLAAGCAATSTKHTSDQVQVADAGLRVITLPVVQSTPHLDTKAYNYYVEGLLYEGEGDLPRAADSYRNALAFFPASTEIALAYARALVQMRQLPTALEVLNKIAVPTSETYALRGLCYRQMGDAEQAKTAYLELARIDSTNNLSYMFLASYYQQRQVYDSAEWALQHLTRLLPDRHEVFNELARVQAAQGKTAAARQTYRRSLELVPVGNNMEALLNLADLFERENQNDSILTLFRASVETAPSNALLHMELARLLLARDSTAQALPHLRAVTRLQPQDLLAKRRLAIVLISLDSLQTADSILTTLVQLGDPDPATHFYLGRLAVLQQNFFRARDEFQIVTERADSLVDGWLGLGFAYRRLNQPDNEIQTYQLGLWKMRNETAGIQLYFALGAAFEQAGKVDSAVMALEEILKHNPDHTETLNYLGYMLADRGIRLEYARDLLKRVIDLEPENPAYLDSYGWVFFRLGQFQEALTYLRKAAEFGVDGVIYDHLGDAYQAVGEIDSARQWWQKALERQPDNETIRRKIGQ